MRYKAGFITGFMLDALHFKQSLCILNKNYSTKMINIDKIIKFISFSIHWYDNYWVIATDSTTLIFNWYYSINQLLCIFLHRLLNEREIIDLNINYYLTTIFVVVLDFYFAIVYAISSASWILADTPIGWVCNLLINNIFNYLWIKFFKINSNTL